MNAVKDHSLDGLYRDNIFGSELIHEGVRFLFPTKKALKSMKNLFIFAMVKKDAVKYLETHDKKNIKWSPSMVYNNKFKKIHDTIIGYDLDSAYWQIARKMNVISENTFNKGYNVNQKHMLLASLSSLGRDKRYTQIRKGLLTKDAVIVKGDDRLKALYKKIRYTCFQHMKRIAKLLKNDFIAYKTDCIYLVFSEKNVKMVEQYFDDHDLDYKVLFSWDKLKQPEYG